MIVHWGSGFPLKKDPPNFAKREYKGSLLRPSPHLPTAPAGAPATGGIVQLRIHEEDLDRDGIWGIEGNDA